MDLDPLGVPSSQEERVLKSLGPDDGKKPWKTVRQAIGMCPGNPFSVNAQTFTVIGGGSNPHGPGLGHERNFRNLTDEPSVTMAAVQVGNRGPWIDEDQERRRLTPEECAALQDFPVDWPFQGPHTSKYRQVGNAVPPGLA